HLLRHRSTVTTHSFFFHFYHSSFFFIFFFFFYCYGALRDLHSFPTRRSSDLFARSSLRTWIAASACRTCWPTCQCREAQRQKITDRKSTRLNSSHVSISYAVFCLKKKKKK